MTSVYRLGHRSSDRHEETVRIGLTEAQAETLAMVLNRVGGANGRNGPGSRRVHTESILEGLANIGILTIDDYRVPITGEVVFPTDDDFDYPLLFEGDGVKFL